MLDAVKAKEWANLPGLEEERRRVIDSAFVPPVPHEEADMMLKLVQEIIAVNLELVASGGEERDAALSELERLGKGKRAAGAYANVKSHR